MAVLEDEEEDVVVLSVVSYPLSNTKLIAPNIYHIPYYTNNGNIIILFDSSIIVIPL